MRVQFKNANVHISFLKQGIVIKYDDDYYHLNCFDKTPDGRFLISIMNYMENHTVSPQFLEWVGD